MVQIDIEIELDSLRDCICLYTLWMSLFNSIQLSKNELFRICRALDRKRWFFLIQHFAELVGNAA